MLKGQGICPHYIVEKEYASSQKGEMKSCGRRQRSYKNTVRGRMNWNYLIWEYHTKEECWHMKIYTKQWFLLGPTTSIKRPQPGDWHWTSRLPGTSWCLDSDSVKGNLHQAGKERVLHTEQESGEPLTKGNLDPKTSCRKEEAIVGGGPLNTRYGQTIRKPAQYSD